MFCHQCGNKLELESQAFCRSCGTAQPASENHSETPTQEAQRSKFISLMKSTDVVVFKSVPEDDFYNEAFEYMFLLDFQSSWGFYTLEDFINGYAETAENAKCEICDEQFQDVNNWFLDDGNNEYGVICWKCTAEILRDRQVFATSISPLDLINSTKGDSHPEGVALIGNFWRRVMFADGNEQDDDKCWVCSSAINTERPHWAVEVTTGYLDSVCESCIAETLMSSNPEFSEF